jgi:hypothetical protein
VLLLGDPVLRMRMCQLHEANLQSLLGSTTVLLPDLARSIPNHRRDAMPRRVLRDIVLSKGHNVREAEKYRSLHQRCTESAC